MLDIVPSPVVPLPAERMVSPSPCLKFSELECDLFSVPSDFSLAHCVSADMQMSRGIAVLFKNKFQSTDFLLQQGQSSGGLAVLPDTTRFVYYLVTKNAFSDKPTYDSLWSSLLNLREHILAYGVFKLAIPALGCGLDGLSWPTVRSLVISCFAEVDIEILVCHFQKKKCVSFSPDVSPTPVLDVPKLNNSFMPTANEWNKWLLTVREFYLTSVVSPLCSTQPGDVRPYLDVQIQSFTIRCLLDSGASHTVLGNLGLSFLDKHHIPYTITDLPYIVSTADGTVQEVLGAVELPFSLHNETRIIKCLVVPSITQSFILGIDFGAAFNICFNFSNNSWSFAAMPTVSAVNVIQPRASLSPARQIVLDQTISGFQELVSDTLGRTNLVEHYIDTGDARPFKQRQYMLSPAMQKHLHREVTDMLKLGVIQPSNSPWSSPILLVTKKNGELRACFDGRKLNSVTIKDAYPLPHIDSILNRLRDARYLSSIDLRKAFWQIPLEQSSQEKTAFCVPGMGLFEFVVMPFGLSNSPQMLQRTMERILGLDLLNGPVFVYLDDIIIASPTFDEHIATLNLIRERLSLAGFRINLDKCEFCRPSLSFLGFIIDQQGLRTDPDKVSAIVNFRTPTNTTEIKRLIGLVSYYRRFIQDFSTVAAPITSLLKGRKKGQPIIWTPEAESAFAEIKLRMTTAPVLASPDFDLPFFIQTDASDVGVGVMLFQKIDGVEHPIAFASRALTAAERKYSSTERELIGVIFGVEKFRGFVEGTKFTVITDCSSLTWLHRLREPTGRLSRWCLRLSQFDFDVQHRPGTQNVIPDALSRNVDLIDLTSLHPDDWYLGMITKVSDFPDQYPDFKVMNQCLYKHLPSVLPNTSNVPDWKLVVPTDDREQILQEMHDDPTSAHLGISKTMSRIVEFYYWPKLKQSVSRYVKNCKICAAQKSENVARPGFMGAEKNISFPFQAISMDLLGPLPKSKKGNQHLLVVTDYFTKFVLVHPLRKATTAPIIKFLREQVFLIFGVPEIVIFDNGPQFKSRELQKFLQSFQIPKIWFNARYHPQVNPTERVNRVLVTAISSYIKDNHQVWDEHIAEIAQALRLAKHDSTEVSPAYLVFGRHVPVAGNFYASSATSNDFSVKNNLFWAQEMSLLPELYDEVKGRLHKAYETNAKTYNLRKRPLRFSLGDIVWKRTYYLSDASKNFSKKLAPKYIACKVTKVISPLVYDLEDMDGQPLGKWHIKDLKPNSCEFEE